MILGLTGRRGLLRHQRRGGKACDGTFPLFGSYIERFWDHIKLLVICSAVGMCVESMRRLKTEDRKSVEGSSKGLVWSFDIIPSFHLSRWFVSNVATRITAIGDINRWLLNTFGAFCVEMMSGGWNLPHGLSQMTQMRSSTIYPKWL